MPASNNLVLDIDSDVSALSLLTGSNYSIINRESTTNTTSISVTLSRHSNLTHSARDIVNKINLFKTLNENWESYGATAPSLSAIDQAISFVRKADRNLLPFYFTAPGPNGELVIEFKKGNREAAAYFNSDSTTELVLSENNQTILEGPLEENYKNLLQFINV